MRKFVTVLGIAAMLAFASAAFAQEEAHFEGYWQGNPNPPIASLLSGRGLVTALYPPLVSNFVANEYTWTMTGLQVVGANVVGTTEYVAYNLAGAQFTVYEDATQDARPTFYNCPSDIVGVDPRYSNGNIYLRGHYTQFNTSFDFGTSTGTFTAQLNWDSGSHLTDLPAARRGAWKFGGTTSIALACIPANYDIAMTGRIFQVTTGAANSTWGQLKKMYR